MFLAQILKYLLIFLACCLCEETTHLQKGVAKWIDRLDLLCQSANKNT